MNLADDRLLTALYKCEQEADKAHTKAAEALARVNRSTKRTIDIYSRGAVTQVANIVSESERATDEFYATYQMLVKVLDTECRPVLLDNPGAFAVQKIWKEIQSLNYASEMDKDYNATINHQALGSVAAVRYSPSIENRMIEKYWEQAYTNISNKGNIEEDEKEYREKKKQNWYDPQNAAKRVTEARSYGVPLEDLYNHKQYLEAKKMMASANTSVSMEQAARIFNLISKYKDSSDLAAECFRKSKELKEEEAATARVQIEEKRQKEEKLANDKVSYQKAMDDYQKEVSSVRKERFDYVENKINEKLKEMIAAEESKRDGIIKKEKKNIEEINRKKQETEIMRAKLGVFKFSEKKESKTLIQQYVTEIAIAENHIKMAEDDCVAAVKRITSKKNNNREQFETEAAEKYPMPLEPEKPESIIWEENEIKKSEEEKLRRMKEEEEAKQKRTKQMKDDIVYYLATHDFPQTATEIWKSVASLENVDFKEIYALLSELVKIGTLKREDISHQPHFCIR